MQLILKKVLIMIGMMVIFASIMQQSVDAGMNDLAASSQSVTLQFDKDNGRDAMDLVTPVLISNPQLSQKSQVYVFYSASYQEPILQVHPKPPIL